MADPYTMKRPMRGHTPTVLVPTDARSHTLTARCECGQRLTVQDRYLSARTRALEFLYREHLVEVVEARQ